MTWLLQKREQESCSISFQKTVERERYFFQYGLWPSTFGRAWYSVDNLFKVSLFIWNMIPQCAHIWCAQSLFLDFQTFFLLIKDCFLSFMVIPLICSIKIQCIFNKLHHVPRLLKRVFLLCLYYERMNINKNE